METPLKHLFAALSLSLVLATPASADAPLTLTLGHAQPQTHLRHLAAQRFADAVARKSSGRVTVRVLPNSEAGDDAAMLKGLKEGKLDLSANSQGPLARDVPEVNALGLPFLFPNSQRAWQVLDGALQKELTERAQAKGYVLLGLWDNGIRHMTNNARPITRPQDLAGLKMRTPADAVTVDFMTALGAVPQQIKFTELHGALANGVVDGQENPLANIESGKLFEVQKHLSLTGHKFEVTPLVMSVSAWGKLSEADRKAVQDAAREATAFQRKASNDAEETALATLKSKGMKVVTVDTAPFKAATSGVAGQWSASEIGPFVKKVLAAAKS